MLTDRQKTNNFSIATLFCKVVSRLSLGCHWVISGMCHVSHRVEIPFWHGYPSELSGREGRFRQPLRRPSEPPEADGIRPGTPDINNLNIGMLLGVTAALSISLTNVFSRAHFEAGSTPTTFLVGRYVIFVVLLTVLFAVTRRLRRISSHDSLELAVAGSLNFLGATCLAFAIQRLQVSMAVAVLYLFPFFVLFTGALLDRRAPHWQTLCGLCVAFVGLLMVLDIGTGARPDPIGILFAVLAAFGISSSFVYIERRLTHLGDAMRLYGISVVGLCGALVLAASTGGVVWPLPQPDGWSTLLVATASFGLASAAMFMAVSRIGATATGLLMNLEPPATAVFAVMLLGDLLTPMQFAGVLIVIVSVAVAQRTGR